MSAGGAVPPAGALYDAALASIFAESLARLRATLAGSLPFLAQPLAEWMGRLSASGRFEDYVQHPGAYPLLLFPWYLGRSISGLPEEADREFHVDLVGSSLYGYSFIRMVDNVMDGEVDFPLGLLPAAGVFHWHFQAAFLPYFAADHPFWGFFRETWSESAEVTARDAFLAEVGEAEFRAISGRKFAASKIPLAAVCHRYGRPDLIAPWSVFLDRFGAWHQMVNDLFDWEKDDRLGHRTFLLGEWGRRRAPGESVAEWMAREGFDWGIGLLSRWLAELAPEVERLECPWVGGYLQHRERLLAAQAATGREGLGFLARLLAAVRGGDRPAGGDAPH